MFVVVEPIKFEMVNFWWERENYVTSAPVCMLSNLDLLFRK